MEKEILDLPEQEKVISFYKKSLQQFVLSIKYLIGIFMLYILERIIINSSWILIAVIAVIYIILVIFYWMNAIKGFVNAVKSFSHKERCGIKGIAVLLGNFILFTAPIAAFLIANILDVYNSF